MYTIDKLMWVFCKNKCVKQKNQILDVQNRKIYAQADVIALSEMLIDRCKPWDKIIWNKMLLAQIPQLENN